MKPIYKTVQFWIILVIVAALASITIVLIQKRNNEDVSKGYTEESGCNIAEVKLHGELFTYTLDSSSEGDTGSTSESSVDQASSENIVSAIDNASKDDSVSGIVLDVDSPGGSPVAGEEIADALKRFGKPSLALIHDEGDSAAYWASTGANYILASANSSVGSIGVTSSYVQDAGQNNANGLQFEQLSIGKYKDIGNPDNPLTPDEKVLILKNDQKIYDSFVSEVAANRHLNVSAVKAVADGSDMTGADALTAHLIDAIGDRATAEEYFKNKVGSDSSVCWY